MMRPSSFAVLALKALQKSMMLTPAWPSAGPTGGAGVAFPAGICSLIDPTTFFMQCYLFTAEGAEGRKDRRETTRIVCVPRVPRSLPLPFRPLLLGVSLRPL